MVTAAIRGTADAAARPEPTPCPDWPTPGTHPGRAPTVYVGTLTGALYLDRPAVISAYATAHEQLQAVALGPKPTRDRLLALAEELVK
ncbi:Scr1 family TA system antitoxin-like transcriptional regulator [Micromonospora sp. NPDC003241]